MLVDLYSADRHHRPLPSYIHIFWWFECGYDDWTKECICMCVYDKHNSTQYKSKTMYTIGISREETMNEKNRKLKTKQKTIENRQE